jgi:hypothetical protein
MLLHQFLEIIIAFILWLIPPQQILDQTVRVLADRRNQDVPLLVFAGNVTTTQMT